MAIINRFLRKTGFSLFSGSAKNKRFRAMGAEGDEFVGSNGVHSEFGKGGFLQRSAQATGQIVVNQSRSQVLRSDFEMKVRAYRFAHKVDILFRSPISGKVMPPKMVSLAWRILRNCSPRSPGTKRKSHHAGFTIIIGAISSENSRGFNSRGVSADSARQFVEWGESFFGKNAVGVEEGAQRTAHLAADARVIQTHEQINSRVEELEALQQQAWNESRRLAISGKSHADFEESVRLAQHSRDLRAEISRLQQQGNNKN